MLLGSEPYIPDQLAHVRSVAWVVTFVLEKWGSPLARGEKR